MQIKWSITKKRGNFRPSLNYQIILESFEKKMAVNALNIQSLIPEIPNSHLSFCLPGENERSLNWQPPGFHYLSVPFFKTGKISEFIRLPFRASGKYPEVEVSFKILRQAYEELVLNVYGQAPFEQKGELDICRSTKKKISAMVTADRLLSLYGNTRNNLSGSLSIPSG